MPVRAPAVFVAAILAFGTGLGACSSTVDVRGYVLTDENLERIQPGLQNKRDVGDILGSPSSVAMFNDETWLYIGRKTSTTAFFKPKILEQHVVAVDFDQAGLVTDVRRMELADGKVINHVSRKTPSPGKELSFLEQLIGNVGKFSGGGLKPGQGAPGSVPGER